MFNGTKHLYEFDGFRLDDAKRLLLCAGEPVPLTPKAFDTLLVLVENSGQVLEKEALMNRVWPGTAVEENNLNQCISALRKALGDIPNEHRYIVTIPGRGYRFVADVRRVPVEEIALPRTPAGWMPGKKSGAIAALSAGLALAGYSAWTWRSPASAGADLAIHSIAVLPFSPLGAADGDEYLGLGLADALITKLSNVRRIFIRPTSSVVRYASVQDPIAAGRELKVDSVLEGKVQRAGERIRLTVQLLRVKDGAPLWADRFDASFTDIFSVQDSISEQVARALTLKLSGDEKKRVTKRYTGNAEAYQSYLKGRYYLNKRNAEDLQRAIGYFEQAIRADPGYAPAYAGLADCYVFGTGTAIPQRERLPKAKAAATRALEIDNSLAEAYAPLAYIKFSQDWDWTGAEHDFRRAIDLNPGYATAHHWYADFLAYQGRMEEALAAIQRARDLDPFAPSINTSVVRILYFAGHYDRAIAEARTTLEMYPKLDQACILLGRAFEQKGMFAEAIAEFKKAEELAEGRPGATAQLGHAYAVSGRKRAALNVLRDLDRMSKQRYVSPFLIATVQAGLGDRDAAIEALRQAREDREGGLRTIKVDPRFNILREDPRFQDLLRQVGLAP